MECRAEHNIGHLERIIRMTLGMILLAIAGLTALPVWSTVVILVIGIVAFTTGMMGFCPLWKIFGMNTSHHTHEHHEP